MERYTVYKHTCPNGKVYIGITKNDPKIRWNGGYGYKSNPHFFNAIKKYGWDNIEHEILATNLSKKDAGDMERLFIFASNSIDRRFGYNNETGGTFGTSHGVETRKRLSEVGKTKVGVLNNFYGHKHSEESKAKMREAKRRNPNTSANARIGGERCAELRRKVVLQLDKEGNIIAEYPSTVEAMLTLTNGQSKFGHIADVCNGKRKTYKGYIWKYKGGTV